MKNIVKLTKIYTPEMANFGKYHRWAIAPAGANAGEEIGETYEVELPERFEVAENKCGFKMIFDDKGEGYELKVSKHGHPYLIGGGGYPPMVYFLDEFAIGLKEKGINVLGWLDKKKEATVA